MPAPKIAQLSGIFESNNFSKAKSMLEGFGYKVYTAPGHRSFELDSLTDWKGRQITAGCITLEEIKNLLEELMSEELKEAEKAPLSKA